MRGLSYGRGLAGWVWAVGVGCMPGDPCAPWHQATRGLQTAQIEPVEQALSSRYLDPLGDGTQVLERVSRWLEHGPVQIRRFQCTPEPPPTTGPGGRTVQVYLEADLPTATAWRATGPFRARVDRSFSPQIQTGFWVALRDAQARTESLERGEPLAAWVHPAASVDPPSTSRFSGLDFRVTHGRLELRSVGTAARPRLPRAHLDLHHRGGLEGPGVLRLTLEPAAGRLRVVDWQAQGQRALDSSPQRR